MFWFSNYTVLEHHIVVPSERREDQQEWQGLLCSEIEGPSWPPLDLEAAVQPLVEERLPLSIFSVQILSSSSLRSLSLTSSEKQMTPKMGY